MVECYLLLYIFDYTSYSDTLTKIKPLLAVVSKLNQSVDAVQAMYGGIKMYLEWKLEESEKHLQSAIIINPNCRIAHLRYSHLLMIGRFSEALKKLHQMMLIDPLSLINYKHISRLFYIMGRFENVVIYLKEALELDANDYETLIILGGVMTELGNYSEAINLFQNSLNIHYNIEALAMIGYVYALSGEREMANSIIKQLESPSEDNCQHPIKLARIYAALEEKETALNYLEQAYSQHEVDLNSLISDPRWATIRHEPKFKELIRKIGLPTE